MTRDRVELNLPQFYNDVSFIKDIIVSWERTLIENEVYMDDCSDLYICILLDKIYYLGGSRKHNIMNQIISGCTNVRCEDCIFGKKDNIKFHLKIKDVKKALNRILCIALYKKQKRIKE